MDNTWGVICRKYSRYEAQVKARHNLSASQSLPLASKCFLLSSSSVLVFSKSKKRDVGGEDEQVRAMQRDSSTYCDEPKDVDEYEAWIHSFRIDDRYSLFLSSSYVQDDLKHH